MEGKMKHPDSETLKTGGDEGFLTGIPSDASAASRARSQSKRSSALRMRAR